MEDQEVQQNNMISNLPLLFANGYPTSLDKITETQLENFIPFMVQCSLGHINLQGKIDYCEPEWWPENVLFTIPFSKPKKFLGNWMEKMKEIVIICYQFHKSVFLLRFCNDLAAYEHASLRFINNYNSTTSLFDRRSNKLLVTFRNENMSYDQPQRSRKCLLQQKTKNGHQADQNEHQMMVEPAPFDIYLCDNCDAELYSKEAILEHEKTCNLDDDVILCDTPEPQEDNRQPDLHKNSENNELCIGFLLNFDLQCQNRNTFGGDNSGNFQDMRPPVPTKDESNFVILDASKRLPRRNRAVHSLARCPTIPLSSPAGQLLVRSTKTVVSKEYLGERLDRMERFCSAPILIKSSTKPKYLERKYVPNNIHCTFKKPQEYSSHIYVFPRRQFSQKRRTENFMFLNSPLIKKCRPISVRLKKITDNEIKRKRISPNAKLNIKLTRDTTRSSNWKISSSPSTEIIVDTIDLCSSDDDHDDTSAVSVHLLKPNVNLNGRNNANSATSPSTSCDNNVEKSRLKKLRNRLNASEITLTPIKKSSSSIKSDYVNTSSSTNNKSCTTTGAVTTNSLNEEHIRILSPSATLSSENAVTQHKPLQPSVFIFSNYTTSPLAVVSPNSTEIVLQRNTANLQADNSIFKSQNQENHLKSTTSNSNSSNGTKRNSSAALTSNANTTAAVEWFPHVNNMTLNSNVRNVNIASTVNNMTHNRIVDRERTSRSLPLMQSFGSPSRIVSIDLTS